MLRDVEHCVFVYLTPEGAPSSKKGSALSNEAELLRLSEIHNLGLKHERKGNMTRSLFPTHYVVLDFSGVTGLDATAARTCFVTLKQTLQQHNISLVFCGVDNDMLKMLKNHEVLIPGHDDPGADVFCHTFETLDEGLEWCENKELEQHGVLVKPKGISGIIETFLDQSDFESPLSEDQISRYFVS